MTRSDAAKGRLLTDEDEAMNDEDGEEEEDTDEVEAEEAYESDAL